MEVLYLLLPISLLFVIGIGAAFWWAIFSGQFDNTDAAAKSIFDDNDTPLPDSTQARCKSADSPASAGAAQRKQ